MSTPKLAKKFGVGKGTIYNWMKLYGIESRTIGQGVSLSQKGMKHSEETRRAMAKTWATGEPQKKQLETNSNKPNGYFKGGRREDIPGYMRSSWEFNFARYLNYKGLKWEYEAETFDFTQFGYTKRPFSYLPDFKVTNPDGTFTYYEIKGREKAQDRSKWKRLKKHYPEIELIVIGSDAYKELEKTYGPRIPKWEYRERRERDLPQEKIKKAYEELQADGWSTSYETGDSTIDLIAFNTELLRFIKIGYVKERSDPSVEEWYGELADMTVPDTVQRELWIYTYGRSGCTRHII